MWRKEPLTAAAFSGASLHAFTSAGGAGTSFSTHRR